MAMGLVLAVAAAVSADTTAADPPPEVSADTLARHRPVSTDSVSAQEPPASPVPETRPGISLGIDFTRSVSNEAMYAPISNFTNFRLARDAAGGRLELESGYFFRQSTRESGSGTDVEKRKVQDHFLRFGAGLYYRSRPDPLALYAGPKIMYQKMFSKITQGESRQAVDFGIAGAGLLLGLERRFAERLSLAGEFQVMGGRGLLDNESLANYREVIYLFSTTGSVVFRWHLK